MVCKERSLKLKSLPSNSVDFSFEREVIELRERQTQEQIDSPVQEKECIAERLLDLLSSSLYRGRIRHAPVGSHGLPGPDWADLIGSIVANREHEIEFGSTRFRKFVPTLAADSGGRNMGRLELFQGLGPHFSDGMAACTVGREIGPAFLIQNGLRHDGTCRISSTE